MHIVTAIDLPYLPGLIALYNSYLENASEHKFTCLVHDEDTLNKVKDLGIPYEYIDWDINFPTTAEWPVASVAMYSRLLLPEIFPSDPKILWIDADAIIVNYLPEFNIEDYPCGSVITSTTTIGSQVAGDIPHHFKHLPAVQTGVLAFNTKEYIKEEIKDKCEFAMTLDYLDFKFVVQSILSYALEGDFYELPYKWNTFANRGPIPKNTLIAHFVGQKFLPWKFKRIPNIGLWERYYNKGIVK